MVIPLAFRQANRDLNEHELIEKFASEASSRHKHHPIGRSEFDCKFALQKCKAAAETNKDTYLNQIYKNEINELVKKGKY